jgi:putative spermidine/putrescine transport system permease protein
MATPIAATRPLPVRIARWLRGDRVAVAVALTPFFLFCGLFELVPVLILLGGALGGWQEPTLQYVLKVFTHPIYRQGVINSLILSTASALIGTVVGTAVGYAVSTTRHERVRHTSTALASLTSSSGGVALAFAFITVLGATGAITIALRGLGIDLYSVFSLYSMTGLIVVYSYFQIPLMVVLMLPAYAAVKPEWREASMVLGGTSRDFWRRVGIPVLAPAIVAGFILMFASGMGAYATAAALVGQFNLMTLQIQRLRAGEVLFDPAQADAMASMLLVFVAVAVLLNVLVSRRARRWAS